MNLNTKLITPEQFFEWNSFVNSVKTSTILSYWQWGEIQKGEGLEPFIVAVYDGSKIIAGTLALLKKTSFFGNILYLPYGPIFKDSENFEIPLKELFSHLKKIALEQNCFVIEAEPLMGEIVDQRNDLDLSKLNIYSNDNFRKALLKLGFEKTTRNTQAKYKLFYDLALSDEILLASMKQSTRYNVHLAERKGVKIDVFYPDDPKISEKILVFYDLLKEMQARASNYPIRSLKFFKELFKKFQGTKEIALIEASLEGETLAMNISEFTKPWASSFYAASSRTNSKVKAPYLLRWASVKLAKEFGSKFYDFWGIVPNSKSHAGYSDMKISFGGVRFDNDGIYALPIKKFRYQIWKIGIIIKQKLFNLKKKFI